MSKLISIGLFFFFLGGGAPVAIGELEVSPLDPVLNIVCIAGGGKSPRCKAKLIFGAAGSCISFFSPWQILARAKRQKVASYYLKLEGLLNPAPVA